MKLRVAPIIPLLFSILGCGGSSVSPYRDAVARAHAAERAKSLQDARSHWADAARLAEDEPQKLEALYRSALTYSRAGELSRAADELERLVSLAPHSARASRALLDAAHARLRTGDEERARANYRRVVSDYPSSPGALVAATRWVSLSERPPAQAFTELIAENREPELDAGLRYRRAQALELIDPEAARAAYEELARLHPLPRGTYADEALLAAARLRRQLKDGEGALQLLTILLESRTISHLSGSYERSGFAAARYLEGEILRDDLARAEEALESFERITREHPTSRLGDDALFEKAWTHFSLAQNGRACDTLERLRATYPGSRFNSCSQLYCSNQEDSRLDVARCCARLEARVPRPSACSASREEPSARGAP